MAAIPVTIVGITGDGVPITIVGALSFTGLSVGGGPMPPGPGQPPGIWGPPGPWPTPPIAFPPGWVGGKPPGQPPGIWPNPPEGVAPIPEHPIVIPPGKPPEPVQPPIEWKAVWVPAEGWVVVGIPNFPHPTPST